MTQEKKDRIAQITSEVDELHPLLESLFFKMPNIQDIEYTHGSSEMGADFVLSSINQTFGITEHIGVIAKVGGIAQNFTDLERQIDECSLPRTFRGGKEKIYLSEIWIVLSGTVTKNAQDKIYEKYKIRKIEFISGLTLIKLIDQHLSHYWNAIPLKTGEYLSQLNTKYREIDTRVSLLNIDDRTFYIDQDVYYNPHESEYTKQKRHRSLYHKVDILDEISKERFLISVHPETVTA